MLSYREPAYQGITEEISANNTCIVDYDVPRRRPMAKNIKDRLANIVSMYVPNNGSTSPKTSPSKNTKIHSELVEERDGEEMNDHFGLLSLSSLERTNSISSSRSHRLCQIDSFLDKASLFSSIAKSLQGSAYNMKEENQLIKCISVDANYLYICLHGLPFIFKLSNNRSDYTSLNLPSTTMTSIHLQLPESVEIIPSMLCLKQTDGHDSEFYVVGDTVPLNSGQSFNILTCFSADGNCIARTRKYNYNRYLAIDIDNDGNPLLACATSTRTSDVAIGAQICKLTPHFERRIFSITMRKGLTSYCPEWITKSSAGGRCWASVSRDEKSADKLFTRRIFAFPGSQPNGTGVVQSPKEWLKVMSWNFDAFSAGSLVALDSERLLAVDTDRRSMAVITWPYDQPSASLQRITKPGERTIDLFCSSYSTPSACDSAPSAAFFVSQGDVFKFSVSPPESIMLHEE